MNKTKKKRTLLSIPIKMFTVHSTKSDGLSVLNLALNRPLQLNLVERIFFLFNSFHNLPHLSPTYIILCSLVSHSQSQNSICVHQLLFSFNTRYPSLLFFFSIFPARSEIFRQEKSIFHLYRSYYRTCSAFLNEKKRT